MRSRPRSQKQPRLADDQREALQAAITRGLAPLRCEPPLTLWEWADAQGFYLSPESSSIEGWWRTLPYQRAIMGAISNDDIEIVTWQKCKRVGYTKILTAAVGYFCSRLRRSTVVYQPIEADSDGYAQDEIEPMLRDCPKVREAMLVDPERKSKHNKKDLKSFVGAALHLRGGKSLRAYRRLTKDVVIYDELSAFDPDIEGAGDPTSLGDGRLETSCFPKSIRGSTPRLKGSCQIEASVADADYVFRRYLECQACRELHLLVWSRMSAEDSAIHVCHPCPHCGYAAAYGELPAMDDDGVWMDGDEDEAPTVRMDDDGQVFALDTEERVDVRHVAFKIWSGYSYYRPWSAIVRDHQRAERKMEAGDHTAMKTFANEVLGETWAEQATEIDPDALYDRREPFSPDSIPEFVKVLTGGVDVQDDRIEATIYGWGYGEESAHVETRKFYGDPSQATLWSSVEEFRRAPRRTVDGRELRVRAFGVDSGHYTDAAYAYCRRRWAARVFALKGRAVEKDRPIITAPTIPKGKGVRLFTLGSWNAKLLILRRLQVEAPGPGYCHIGEGFSADYCAQLTAEKLVIRSDRKGREVQEFVAVQRRNEGLDLFQYGLLALYVLSPAWLGREPPLLESPDGETPAPPEPLFRRRQDQRRPPRNWVNSWR